ncbi:protein of unknown function [Cardinium endosymbiont cEper1 of Encarsia pergandiella]|nr:hypothetical protein [Cardinium endosymbiont of Encarsia pergandiella]CCM10464.1 protein of unknown function [Cardinium endosymbiont cEper1 of Encarsia pergandiella]
MVILPGVIPKIWDKGGAVYTKSTIDPDRASIHSWNEAMAHFLIKFENRI